MTREIRWYWPAVARRFRGKPVMTALYRGKYLEVAFGWLKLIWSDGGHPRKLVREVVGIPHHRTVKLQIVKRSDDVNGFKVLPMRWIAKGAFGWRIQSRRPIRDYGVSI